MPTAATVTTNVTKFVSRAEAQSSELSIEALAKAVILDTFESHLQILDQVGMRGQLETKLVQECATCLIGDCPAAKAASNLGDEDATANIIQIQQGSYNFVDTASYEAAKAFVQTADVTTP